MKVSLRPPTNRRRENSEQERHDTGRPLRNNNHLLRHAIDFVLVREHSGVGDGPTKGERRGGTVSATVFSRARGAAHFSMATFKFRTLSVKRFVTPVMALMLAFVVAGIVMLRTGS